MSRKDEMPLSEEFLLLPFVFAFCFVWRCRSHTWHAGGRSFWGVLPHGVELGSMEFGLVFVELVAFTCLEFLDWMTSLTHMTGLDEVDDNGLFVVLS
jgi:hypothetical protein